MSPKVISGEVFKNRKEIALETYKDLIADGGVEKIKTVLVDKWRHNPGEIIAVPSLTINTAGKLSGAKWYVIGKLAKDINLKLTQLNSDADDDIFLCIKNLEMSVFPFYNKRRNTSGWIDSSELDFSMFRKAKSKKQPIQADQFADLGMKGFCVRIGILPVSSSTASLTIALHPMNKDELKAKAPDSYYKNGCPQVALPIGENNTKHLTIRLGILEPSGSNVGMGVFPIMEDLRGEEETTNVFPTSLEVRTALHNFMRTVKGFNNKSAKKVMEAMEDITVEMAKNYDPELIWPEAASVESDEPVDELGKCHDVRRQY